jgi:pimeloyl-ACP methyl ester carboxylesterase
MLGRRHGDPPYRRVVVHGGPGAPGSAYGLAKGIGSALEPYQSRRTLEGQIEELSSVVRGETEPPVVLVGHSWGAMLALLTAAAHPDVARKVVLVGSGGFTADSYVRTNDARMARLAPSERTRAEEIRAERSANPHDAQSELMLEYYRIISLADAFDGDPEAEDGCAEFQNDVNKKVWADAVALRESGELLERVARVKCPVIAIHGDHDPHPADAVADPLSRTLASFRMIVLPKCGHEPWNERQARHEFFALLRQELAD